MRIHHVQVSCPPGDEDRGRHFYVDGLGFREIAEPAKLCARGGAWFRHDGGAEIHLGVEEPVLGRKAHPALEVGTTTELEGPVHEQIPDGQTSGPEAAAPTPQPPPP